MQQLLVYTQHTVFAETHTGILTFFSFFSTLLTAMHYHRCARTMACTGG